MIDNRGDKEGRGAPAGRESEPAATLLAGPAAAAFDGDAPAGPGRLPEGREEDGAMVRFAPRNGAPAVAAPKTPRPAPRERGASVCSHLGLENDPFDHYPAPSSEHRCYLWMQRDRIDRSHQDMFCLAAGHKDCPWLAISAPKTHTLRERAATALSERLQDRVDTLDYSSWRRELFTLLIKASVVAARCARLFWRYARPALAWIGVTLLVLLHALIVRFNLHQNGLGRFVVRRIEPAIGRRPPGGAALAPRPNAAFAATAVAGEGSAGAQLHLQRGMEAVRDGDPAAALRRFRLATAADEGNEQAWTWRAALAETDEEKSECFRRMLAIDPQNARARSGLAEFGLTPAAFAGPSGVGPRPMADTGAAIAHEPAGVGSFFEQGMAAMHAGNEELAYHYFSLVSATEPENEQAWYWRARTAPTLDGVIHGLQHILEINPANGKVEADLRWALQRRQREQAAEARKADGPKVEQPKQPSNLVLFLRRGLLQLASVAAFLLGLLFSLPFVVGLTDLATVPEYQQYLRVLPGFKLPALPLPAELAGVDLGAALPLLLGLLLLHAAFTLGDGGGRGIRLWTALLGGGALVLLLVFAKPASPIGLTLAAAAAALALLGDNRQPPRRGPAFGSF